MTVDERRKICDDIYQYIIEELDDWMDNQIFTKTSMEDLGELYYNRILNQVENADTCLLNAVISTEKPTDMECITQEDYYSALCKILHFKKLPSELWKDVDREYNEIFVQKYGVVMQKYQTQINKINAELAQIKTSIDEIKNEKPSYSFKRDISTEEQKLYELSSECNYLRTRKEMLTFTINNTTSKLSDFCDIQDIQSIENAKKQETLNLSKEDAYSANLSFLSYRDYVEIAEDDLDRPYALFFKVKIYVIIEIARKQYKYSCSKKSVDEAIDEYQNYLQYIPKIDDLQLYKSNSANDYNSALEKLILDYRLVEELQNNLEASVCLRRRKHILLKAVELYKQGEYEVFNNILPIQIEGMFEDYLQDTTTFLRFSKMDLYLNDVLKDKIRHLQEVKSDIYPEAVEYFMYYFNNMIRNKIAHGRYKGNPDEQIQDEIFAKELILDMGMLVHMLSRQSETEKMYYFIHGYQKYYQGKIFGENSCFEALFNDMIGKKIIADYDTLEQYRPIQVVYWLINPYYEKIYEKVDDKKDLLELRKEFLSEEFWEYVLDKLNNVIDEECDYLGINMEFLSIVNGLFSYGVSEDLRKILGKVHAALTTIKKLQQ